MMCSHITSTAFYSYDLMLLRCYINLIRMIFHFLCFLCITYFYIIYCSFDFLSFHPKNSGPAISVTLDQSILMSFVLFPYLLAM